METPRGLYAAMARMDARHRAISEAPAERAGDGEALTSFELRVFSQNGEDGVIAEIATRIGAGERSFVEFGIETGREGNCVYLADVAGWPGLFIEGDPRSFALLQRKYRGNERVRTTRAIVTPENVQELFAAGDVPAEPTVLSIDVDGADYWIWEAIEEFRPRIVVIEYNSSLDPHGRLVQPPDLDGEWDSSDYYGASLGALRTLGERKGYRLVHTELCAVNAFFVREDLAVDRFPASERVPVRAMPNYFQTGRGHPSDPAGRRYLDLDTNELVSVPTSKNAPTLAELDEFSLLRERASSAEEHLARSRREMADASSAYEATRRAYEAAQSSYEASETAYRNALSELEAIKRELSQRERSLDRANTLLAERNATLRVMSEELAQLRMKVSGLEEKLAEASASLAIVTDSKSWRLTAPLRALRRVTRHG